MDGSTDSVSVSRKECQVMPSLCSKRQVESKDLHSWKALAETYFLVSFICCLGGVTPKLVGSGCVQVQTVCPQSLTLRLTNIYSKETILKQDHIYQYFYLQLQRQHVFLIWEIYFQK